MSFAPPDPSHGPVADTPLPPPPIAPVDEALPRRLRAGDLTATWRMMVGAGWVAAFFAYAGVWNASVQIGISTWWIGPRAQPTNIAIKLIPFLLAVFVTLLVLYNVQRLVAWNAAAVALSALISIPDFSRSVGLGVAEATIAGLLALIAAASLSGRYRSEGGSESP